MPKVTELISRRAGSLPRPVRLPNKLRLFLVHRAALKIYSDQREDTLFGAARKDDQNRLFNERRNRAVI